MDDPWVPVDKALAILRDKRWSWASNHRCKYVELRIDTRDMHCTIRDRDGKSITLKQLSRQMDTYLEPEEEHEPDERAADGDSTHAG
jgi:hypothetical protein